MPRVNLDTTIWEYQNFVKVVYGKPNDLHYDLSDMLNNIQRFAMRALKGVRKGDSEKTRTNLMISLSWFMSTMNRFHINLEEVVWKRFPYLCSYCGTKPCSCKSVKGERRTDIVVDDSLKPHTLEHFQNMFKKIYPPEFRTLEHAAVHLAEEIGEFSEAMLTYRGEHREDHRINISMEAADVFSCFMGIFNSLNSNLAQELFKKFPDGCHECRKTPCECDFSFVMRYNS